MFGIFVELVTGVATGACAGRTLARSGSTEPTGLAFLAAGAAVLGVRIQQGAGIAAGFVSLLDIEGVIARNAVALETQVSFATTVW